VTMNTLQGIFQQYFPAYAREHKLPLRVWKAASAIMHCRTPMMGGHLEHCPNGHLERVRYHSCRHRSCSRCSSLPRAQWAEQQAARLLPCDHYHVVFTLPHELLALWQWNRPVMTGLLFQAARETLLTLLDDPRFLGATPGLLLALHTWGRTLNPHPHVHCLVTGGGLTPRGEWKAVTNGYLLPVRVVKALFRGKLLALIEAGLREGALCLDPKTSATAWARTVQALYAKHWNVCLTERYAHGEGVTNYLARYVKGGPLHEARLRAVSEQTVAFAYRDHRDGKDKTMHLPTGDFLTRLLWHVPEPGQHTIRHAGLYATQNNPRRVLARACLGQPQAPSTARDWRDALQRLGHADKIHCPHCGTRLVRGLTFGRARGRDENSSIKAVPAGLPNKVVQADTPNVLSFGDTGPPGTGDIFLGRGVRLN
jgi:hypothetical protein